MEIMAGGLYGLAFEDNNIVKVITYVRPDPAFLSIKVNATMLPQKRFRVLYRIL